MMEVAAVVAVFLSVATVPVAMMKAMMLRIRMTKKAQFQVMEVAAVVSGVVAKAAMMMAA